MILFYILIGGFLTRACGASWKFPGAEWVFAVPFAFVTYSSTHNPYLTILAYFVTYIGMQLGHGNFYKMKGVDPQNDKPKKIEWIARKIYPNIYTTAYSCICMGLKGLVIGFAAFPLGLALAVLWPAAYWLGWKLQKNDSATAEYLAGACAGLILYLAGL